MYVEYTSQNHGVIPFHIFVAVLVYVDHVLCIPSPLLVGRGKKQFKLKTHATLFLIQSMTGKKSKYRFSQKGETGQPKNWHTHDAILYRRPVVVVVGDGGGDRSSSSRI
jgi:hypothetical protein